MLNTRSISRLPIGYTWEELGRNLLVCIDGTVHVTVTPGEKCVMYDRDGGGYPGSPPECELDGVEIERITGYTLDGDVSYSYSRTDRPDWIRLCENVLERKMEGDWDEAYWFDRVADAYADREPDYE